MRKAFLWFLLGFGLLFLLILQLISSIIYDFQKYKTLDAKPPLVVGHRGASGLLPAHTLPGYLLAIEQGADIIEPDLVMTKDEVLICRHEPMLSMSTNVASFPEFANRRKWRWVSGIHHYDWFTSDFTLEEIEKLGAIQANSRRPQDYNAMYQIVTFDQVIELVKIKSAELGKTIGIYPELKHPTFHEKLKLPITEKLLEALDREGWNHRDSPVYVQSTEVATLQYIRSKSTVKLMQLCLGFKVNKEGKVNSNGIDVKPYDFVMSKDNRTFSDLTTDEGLDFVKTYADVIGVWTPFILPYTFQDLNNDTKPDDLNGDGIIDNRDYIALPPTDLVERAHKRGILVHVFTFRNEASSLLNDYEGDPIKEYEAFFKLGVDGVFSDFPGTAFGAREKCFPDVKFNYCFR